jgi:cytoskeletal protein CcmA (bactofilin family)
MWSKKRDEELAMLLVPPADTQAVPAAPVEMSPAQWNQKKEELPVSSMPLGGRIKPENHGPATIGKAVKVVGQIYSKEDLCVDGDLEGTVEALEHKLTIGPNGTVHADVKAREVAVLGSLQGDVEADKIEIRKDAKLVGNIKTARIFIEDGAYFKGGIDVVKAEPKAAPEAQQSAPAPPSAGPVAQPVHAPKWTPEGRT